MQRLAAVVFELERELLAERRRHVAAAAGDLADGAHQLFRRAFLGEVPHGAGLEHPQGELVLGVHREDDDAGIGAAAEDVAEGVDAAAVGERKVEQDHVPWIGLCARESLTDRGGLAEAAEPRVPAQQLDESLAHDGVIIGHEHADHGGACLGHLSGTQAVSFVPFPVSPLSSMNPPRSRARSRMPRMPSEPWPACAASGSPLPLSVTSRYTIRLACCNVTSTRLAPE